MTHDADTTRSRVPSDIEELVNAVGGVVWEYDFTNEIYIFVSDGALKLLGYPPSDWLVEDFWTAHIHPDDLPWVQPLTDHKTELMESHELTYRMVHRDGSVVWVREIITPQRLKDGRILQRGLMIDITRQKVAEAVGEHAEAGFREMVEAGGRLAAKIDLVGRFTYVSSALCELVGMSESELLGTSITLVLHPEERARVMSGHRDHMLGRPVPNSFRTRMRTLAGETRLVELQTAPLIGPDDHPVGATVMGEDITERDALRLALERTAEEFDAIFSLLPDLYLRVDELGVVRECRARTPHAFLPRRGEPVGKPVAKLLPSAIAERLRQAAEDAHRTGTMAVVEYALSISKEPREFEARLLPVAETTTALMIRDITARRARERALAESRDFLERLLGLIDSGVSVLKGPDLVIQTVNRPAEVLSGYTREELVGRSVLSICPDRESLRSLSDAFLLAMKSVGRYNAQLKLSRKDGEEFDAEVAVRKIDPAGDEYLAVVRDVSDRMEAERQIRENETQFRTIVEQAPFGLHFYRLDQAGELVFAGANPAAERLLGVAHQPMSGSLAHTAAARPPFIADLIGACTVIAQHGGTHRAEYALDLGGEQRVFSITVFRTMPGTAAVAFVDVTEWHENEARERQYKERLSALTADLVGAEDRERRRLAEELHDRVSQALAVARMHLGAAVDRAPEEVGEARDSLALLDEAIREARAITTELSPPVLYELGIGPAMFWLADRVHKKHDVHCLVVVSDEVHPGEELAAFLFRSARELLVNVGKYAKTDSAWLSLDRVEGGIVLTVEDQGVGFDESALSAPGAEKGFGLFSVRDRTLRLGGTFELETAPGHGARVTITVPTS